MPIFSDTIELKALMNWDSETQLKTQIKKDTEYMQIYCWIVQQVV